jgi:D-lactate dehydrogenase
LAGVLGKATEIGKLPVVCDATSCTESLAHLACGHGLQVIDSVSFVRHQVLPLLTLRRRLPSLVLHPTCASTRLGLNDDMVGLASEISDSVVIPNDWGCCGFAGDRGLLRPELTRAATAPEAAAVTSAGTCSGYASSNRTCEVAMTRATGFNYRHLLELTNEATC